MDERPAHSHSFEASMAGAVDANPSANVVAQVRDGSAYVEDRPPTVALAPESLLASGGNHPHGNVQPYLCVGFVISLFGAYPSGY